MSTLRQRNKEKRSQRIYEAALAEFREAGYDGTTMETVAQRAGVARKTVFNLYSSKVQILGRFHAETTRAVLDEVERSKGGSAVASIRLALESFGKRLGEERILCSALLTNVFSSATLRQQDEEDSKRWGQWLKSAVNQAQDEGAFRRDLMAEEIAAVIGGVFSSVLVQWTENPANEDLCALLSRRFQILFDGIGAPTCDER